jgi:hypothetical protein
MMCVFPAVRTALFSCNNEPTEVPQALTFMLDVHMFSYYKLPSIYAFTFKY